MLSVMVTEEKSERKELVEEKPVRVTPVRSINRSVTYRKPVNQQPVGGIPGLQARIRELRATARNNIGWEPGLFLTSALDRVEELEHKIPMERVMNLVDRRVLARRAAYPQQRPLDRLLVARQPMMRGFEASPAVQVPPPVTQSVPYSPEREEVIRDRRREEERRRRRSDMSVAMY